MLHPVFRLYASLRRASLLQGTATPGAKNEAIVIWAGCYRATDIVFKPGGSGIPRFFIGDIANNGTESRH